VAPLALLAIGIDHGTRDPWTSAMYRAAKPWAYAAVVALLAGTLGGALLLRSGRRWLGLAAVALAGLLLIECIEEGYEKLSPRQSGKAVAQAMKPWLKPSTRLYSVNHYDQTVPFYIKRKVMLVNYRDEFETGLEAEPGLALWETDEFEDEWLRPGDALAIMQPGTFEKFRRLGLPMQVLHEDPRRVLVRKP
jgi:hypothetical protein